MVAKITGFGVALEGYKGNLKAPGALDFMPPEAFTEPVSYGLPLDVFSYGGIALFAVVGEWPKTLYISLTLRPEREWPCQRLNNVSSTWIR